MTTTVMTVNAPSEYTRQTYLASLKNKMIGAAHRSLAWGREMSRRTGLDRVTSFIKKYAAKAYNLVSTVVRAAGAVPLSILALTSHTGQRAIKAVAKWTWGLWSWGCNQALGIIDWTMRLFGKPGNRVADKLRDVRTNVSTFITTNAQKFARVAAPYISPDRTYMRAGKGVSYVIVAANLVARFVPGVWKIPAYIVAALFGALSVPEIRTSVLVNRVLGAFEDQTKSLARRTMAESMEAMTVEYGPDMESWTASAKSDYAIKRAVYRHVDDDPKAFEGLTGNQKRRAETIIKNFSGDLAKLEIGVEGLAGNLRLKVAADGHITTEPLAEV